MCLMLLNFGVVLLFVVFVFVFCDLFMFCVLFVLFAICLICWILCFLIFVWILGIWGTFGFRDLSWSVECRCFCFCIRLMFVSVHSGNFGISELSFCMRDVWTLG